MDSVSSVNRFGQAQSSGMAPAARPTASEAAAPVTRGDAISISGAAAVPASPSAPAAAAPSGECCHATGASVGLSLAATPAAGAALEVAGASAPKPADLTAQLKALLPERPFVVTAEKAAEIMKKLDLSEQQLLQALVPVAREFARPPISNYLVGAAGLGKSHNIYLGVNLEFPGNALNQTVHGEQFVVTNALRNGEEQLTSLAVSAAPCGHCRQWLNETSHGSDIEILVPKQPPTPIGQLLPAAFGPGDLGVTSALLSPQNQGLERKGGQACSDAELADAAFDAANHSYAPYSKEGAGVAVRLKDGSIYTGKYSENAAFNPSLSPLQGAIIGMVSDGKEYKDIERVVLVERDGAMASQQVATRSLLASLQPEATFEVVLAEPLKK